MTTPRTLTRVFGFAICAMALLGAVGLSAGPASAATAQIAVTRASGAAVAENGVVTVREGVTIHVSGFAPGSLVLLQFGDQQLGDAIATDGSGAGSLSAIVPKLPSDAYLLTASSDATVATFAISLVNPKDSKVTATPSPTSTAKATTPPPAPSSTPRQLASTGPTSPGYGLAAILLLVVGVWVVRAAAPIIVGRHERMRGSHRRR